jgi:hypothetical protein
MEPLATNGRRDGKSFSSAKGAGAPISIRDEPAYRAMVSAAEKVRIQPLPLTSQYVASLQPFLEALFSKHHLAGLVARTPEPTVLFRLADGTPDADIIGKGVRIWPWGWPGRFGASLTLSAKFLGSSATCRVAVGQGSESLDIVANGKFQAVFLRGRRPIAAFHFDFAESPEPRQNLHTHVSKVREHAATILADEAAHYWETINCQHFVEKTFTVADRLAIGWYRMFEKSATILSQWIGTLRERQTYPDAEGRAVPASVSALLETLRNPACDVAMILGYMQRHYDSDTHELAGLVGDWLRIDPSASPEWEELRYLIGEILFIYNSSPGITQCGMRLFWYDFVAHDFRSIQLEPREFPAGCRPEEFWGRVPRDTINYGWGRVLSGHDFPIDPELLIKSASALPMADDPGAVSASADALFEEAVANKRGTIPHRAHVQLKFGPFTHVEVTELDPNVMFVCRAPDGTFYKVCTEPKCNYCSFQLPGGEKDGVSEELKDRVETGVKLLFAAIVRDFWVVENRETVFSVSRPGERGRAKNVVSNVPRVVYIPRIRYSPCANVEKCAEELSHPERRAHFVRAHVRKAGFASDYQLVLAQRYGVDVPSGYTFVRPHERGKGKRDVIYRSRSALQCLYTVATESVTSGRSHWFQFERDVYKLMDALGFAVEHIAASRHGDGGIDVFATKGRDFDQVAWVIQCKCWHPKRKVPPNIVRELVGVLAGYPHGTRGMVVTTSSFSSGAIDTAKEANIRLVDGDEFVALVKSVAG